MYQAEGIDLSKSEYEELVALAQLEDGWEQFADGRIGEDSSLIPVYYALYDYGLIEGFSHMTGLRCRGIARKGYDWLASYEKNIRDAKKLSRREIKLAAWNTLGGAVAGGVVAWALYALFGIG